MTILFDSHLHIIDERFPLITNQGYKPAAFSCQDYRARTQHLNIAGGAVVSGSFQGFDQRYLLAALAELGPSFVGVTQLPVSTSDQQITALDEAGVRAVRFNVMRGGSEDIAHLESFARRIYDLAGWHVELYVDSRHLEALADRLLRLPAVAIDHLGLSSAGLPTLLKLVEQGARVKATGFGRLDFDPKPALKAIAAANPDALLFGTDLPSTRAKRPFLDTDIELIVATLGPALAEKVLYRNAVAFYRPRFWPH